MQQSGRRTLRTYRSAIPSLRLQQNVYAILLSTAIAAHGFPVKSYFALKVDLFEALVGLVGEQGFGQKAAKVYIKE
jgi:hypothetical protein